MSHVLKVGPVELEGNATNVYLHISESSVSQPVFGDDDAAAVRELVGAEPAAEVRCEPALEGAAKALGIKVEEPPTQALVWKGAIAVFMAWTQRGIAALGSDKALVMVQAATEFWNARPWVHWREFQPMEVSFTGAFERTYEGSLFGTAEGHGIALYEQRGSLKRVVELQLEGKQAQALSLPAIALTLDRKPEYAAKALEDSGALPRVPVPLRAGYDGVGMPRPEEVIALAAALKAFAKLTPKSREVSAEASAGPIRLSVKIVAPPVVMMV